MEIGPQDLDAGTISMSVDCVLDTNVLVYAATSTRHRREEAQQGAQNSSALPFGHLDIRSFKSST